MGAALTSPLWFLRAGLEPVGGCHREADGGSTCAAGAPLFVGLGGCLARKVEEVPALSRGWSRWPLRSPPSTRLPHISPIFSQHLRNSLPREIHLAASTASFYNMPFWQV